MKFYTVTKLGKHTSMTPEGYLLAEAVPVARCGEQVYHQSELPLEPNGDGFVVVSRDPDEVFRDESIRSFQAKPIVNDHPVEEVGPGNWNNLAIGVMVNPRRGTGADDDVLLADLLFTTPVGIQLVKQGKRAVSVGYDAHYDQTAPGRGRQKNIVCNHLALVDVARCGVRCTIMDGHAIYDDDWNEADHPRGQPGNAGQFAKGAGGGGGSISSGLPYSGGSGAHPAENPKTSASFSKSNPPPDELNGIKFQSYSAPTTNKAWEIAAKNSEAFDEPPLPTTNKTQGAGVIIQEPDGRVWIVHPTNEYGGYKATFPKGTVEPGMSHRATAIKEAYEESGLRVTLTGFAGDVERTTSTARYYFARRLTGTPADHGWESEKVTLAPVSELKDHLNHKIDHKMVDDFLAKAEASAPAEAKPAAIPQPHAMSPIQKEMHLIAMAEGLSPADKIAGIENIAAKYQMTASNPSAPYQTKLVEALKQQGASAESTSTKPLSVATMKKVGQQLGSNPGGQYEDASGKKYYVKASKSDSHAKNELLAARLYEAAGAPVLNAQPIDMGGGKLGTATEWKKVDLIDHNSPEQRKAAQANFATHAWLANWDAAGLSFDNQGMVDGKMTTLDPGGSLIYRAQGTPKGDLFGDKVTEWDTLRSPNNAQAHKLFGSMTSADLRKSALNVARVSDKTIRAMVSEHGPGSEQEKAALADKMIARKRDIVSRVLSTNDAAWLDDDWFADIDYPQDMAA